MSADAHAHHPSERSYWVVFVVLAVLTAVEVAWSYIPGLEGAMYTLPLIAMMVAKFLFVAGWFMHLLPDMKALNGRVFTITFAGGVLLASLVYLVVFAAFDQVA